MTAEHVFVLMGAALTLYLLTGGADFGGGIWDLLAGRGERGRARRRVIAEAIAPIWEANHIWLILLVVLLFTVFPVAFAAMSIALHIPLAIALVGIVLRGSAFVFRAYGLDTPTWQSGWGRVFAVSSLLTPWFLGAAFASLATGAIRWDGAKVTSGFVAGWTSGFAALVGAMTVAFCALLAAVYLAVERDGARDAALSDDFRRRAVGAQVATGLFGTAALGLATLDAPAFFDALLHDAGVWVLGGTMALGFATLALLLTRRVRGARIGAAGQAVGVVLGFGLAMQGHLVRPDLPLTAAGARAETLAVLGPTLAIGAVVLIPALWWLFRVFKAR